MPHPWMVYGLCRTCRGVVMVESASDLTHRDTLKTQMRAAHLQPFAVAQAKVFEVGHGLKPKCSASHEAPVLSEIA